MNQENRNHATFFVKMRFNTIEYWDIRRLKEQKVKAPMLLAAQNRDCLQSWESSSVSDQEETTPSKTELMLKLPPIPQSEEMALQEPRNPKTLTPLREGTCLLLERGKEHVLIPAPIQSIHGSKDARIFQSHSCPLLIKWKWQDMEIKIPSPIPLPFISLRILDENLAPPTKLV